MQDCYGRTALMYALLYGNVDCALILLQHKRFYEIDSGKEVQLEPSGSFTLQEGGTKRKLRRDDVREEVTDHCGQGIHLLDGQQRSALFYAVCAGLADDSVLTPDGQREISTIDYSIEFGALKVFKLLTSRKVKFSPYPHVITQLLRIATGFGCPQVLESLTQH